MFLDHSMEETQQLLDEIVLPEEIQRYRTVYEKAKEANQLTEQNKFSFAYCLVRSKAKADVRHGLALLRELYDATRGDDAKRDYLYYLALGKSVVIEHANDLFTFFSGNARLNEYEAAMKFLDAILHVQPGNHQAKNLREEIDRRMTREGCRSLINMLLIITLVRPRCGHGHRSGRWCFNHRRLVTIEYGLMNTWCPSAFTQELLLLLWHC
jgi:mitochondrial fission 1 protein